MAGQRSTKKQQELLQFVDGFIKGHGFGPSYREIMRALGYKSVSTVAIHIDQLIVKGYLEKTTHSARSLSVVSLREHHHGDGQKDDKNLIKKNLEAKLHQLQRAGETDKANVLRQAAEILEITIDSRDT